MVCRALNASGAQWVSRGQCCMLGALLLVGGPPWVGLGVEAGKGRRVHLGPHVQIPASKSNWTTKGLTTMGARGLWWGGEAK